MKHAAVPPGRHEECDPLLEVTADLEEAVRFLDLEPWIVARLRHAEREVTLNLPIHREDGSDAVLCGLRVQHCLNMGPTMGPVFVAADADAHRIRAAAMEATWQTALLEMPFGGAAGAVVCRNFPPSTSLRMEPPQSSGVNQSSSDISEQQMKTVLREYARGLRGISGAFSDVLTPGPGCNEQIMAWMLSDRANQDPREIAAVTGKPAVLSGLNEYYEMEPRGIVCLLREILGGLSGQRVSLQGFGNLGAALARRLHQAGAGVVAVADLSGGVRDSAGLNVDGLAEHAVRKGVLFGYTAEAVSNADVLEAACDILILAATEQQVEVANAERIRARIVVEAVNGAVTREAEEMLTRRGVVVAPHMLSELGALIAAQVEWKQNVQLTAAPPDVEKTVESCMRQVWTKVKATAGEREWSLRKAATMLSVRRVAEQIRATE